MKNLLLLLLISIFVMACDIGEGPKGSKNIVKPTLPKVREITFKNVDDLKSGRYRIKPTHLGRSSHLSDITIGEIIWGNVDKDGKIYEREDLPKGAPKRIMTIELDPRIYGTNNEGQDVIRYNERTREVYDEIIISITKKRWDGEVLGGTRDNQFRYKYIRYTGKAIENVTKPDRKFEYIWN